MTAEEKRFKNLSTYAIIMVLAVVILIIIAAMADNREEEFRNEQQQTVTSIQNEIVRLSDENHNIKKENESLKTDNDKLQASNDFYALLISAWESYSTKNYNDSYEKLLKINPDALEETQKASYDTLGNLIKKETGKDLKND